VQDKAQIGAYQLPVYALSEAGRVKAEISLEVVPKSLLVQSSILKSSIFAMVVIVSFLIGRGMKKRSDQ
jgi:hypothetical protein